MTRITIDADLRGKLLELAHPLELCDETGRVLARVMPVTNGAAAPVEPFLSEEELQRREQEEPEYTTAEVLAFLEKL